MEAKKIAPTTSALRFSIDEKIFNEILSDKSTQSALDKVDNWSSGHGFSHRRHLLSNTVRLNKHLCPDIFSAFIECKKLLEMENEPVELYVASYLGVNAYATTPKVGPSAVVLGSDLIACLNAQELKFVIGHELGHIKFLHTKHPLRAAAHVEDAAGRILPLHTLLKVYTWSRAAEVSADRAGLYCVKDLPAAISCIFKLASGLNVSLTSVQIQEFVNQIEDMISTPIASQIPIDRSMSSDSFQTHPFNPLRVRAMSLAAHSGFVSVNHPVSNKKMSVDEMDSALYSDLKIMEPDYLQQTDGPSKDLKDLLLYAGLTLAQIDGAISESETHALKALVGASKLNVDVSNTAFLKDKVDYLTAKCATSCDILSKNKLLQHLVLISFADNTLSPNELNYIYELCTNLNADSAVISAALHVMSNPMD